MNKQVPGANWKMRCCVLFNDLLLNYTYLGCQNMAGWWFGTFFIFPWYMGIIIPTDQLIFFKMVIAPPSRWLIWVWEFGLVVGHHVPFGNLPRFAARFGGHWPLFCGGNDSQLRFFCLKKIGRWGSWISITILYGFNIAMEHGPFIDGLPINNGDFHSYVK